MKRTALITGSTSGIGKGIATAFAKLGYNIVFNGLEPNGADIAKEIATNYGVDYIFSAANMMHETEIKALTDEALAKFGTVDILVNNAGIQFVSPVEDFPTEKWDAIIAINLTAPFHLTKNLWPKMKENKFGRIINIASAHGLTSSPFKSAYVASKHGIVGFTKTIALEGAAFGITANSVCPGYVHTPIIDNQIADQMKAYNMTKGEVIEKVMLSKQAIKEFIPIDLVVDTVLFLAADSAKTITGIAFPVDGGWTAE